MTIAPERIVAAPPREPESPPAERDRSLPVARIALAGALSSAAGAWVVGGLIRGATGPRLIALLGVAIGVGLIATSTRLARPAIGHYAVLPVALAVGGALMAAEARGGTANVFGLIAEALGGGVKQPPLPFDPGWRMILVVLFAVTSAAAVAMAIARQAPRLAIALPLPLVLGAALFQPKGTELAASAPAIVLVIAALGIAYGADLAREGVATRGFETRRLARGGAMLLALIVVMIALGRADALFPDTSRDPILPPRRPPPATPEPDRLLFTVRSDRPGPWRAGVLDVFDGAGWLLPAQNPAAVVPWTDTPTERATTETTVEIADMRGRSLPVPGGLVSLRAAAPVELDTITGVPRLQRRIPQGFTYTATAITPPTGRELNTAPAPPREIERAFVDGDGTLPPPPHRIATLLGDAPQPPFDRLQFLRDKLYATVVAAGGGSPVDVPAARVAEMFAPGAEATPFEITAAEALLARWAGWPSRIGYGYFRGDEVAGGFAVHPRHASAWLEIYAEGFGWVPLVGTPVRAKPSDDASLKNIDPRVRPSEELALTVFIPHERTTFKALFEIVRWWLLMALPFALGLVALWLLEPVALKAVRSSRRRRWGAARGPAARALAAYAEFRDRCTDLNAGDPRDTPLEFLRTFADDDEHAELAWLVTRLTWGDLGRAPRPEDADAAEEMARSLIRRAFSEQPLTNRFLARVARASLRDPYTDAVPGIRADLGVARTLRASLRGLAAPVRMVRRIKAARATASLLILVLAASACARAERFDAAVTPVAYPERIAPEPPETLLGYRFVREPAAEQAYVESKHKKLVTEGRVYTVHQGDVIQASLQVSLFRPDVDATDRTVRERVEASIGGSFTTARVGTARLRVRQEPERSLHLWFPPDRNVMQLLVARAAFDEASLLMRALIAYQRSLPVDLLAARPRTPTQGGTRPDAPTRPTAPGQPTGPTTSCRTDGDAKPTRPLRRDDGPREFTLVPPGPVSDRAAVEARVAVRNPTDQQASYTVRFWWDSADAIHVIGEQTITVPPKRSRVAAVTWKTEGYSGARTIIYRTQGPGVDATGSRPLRVVRSATRALPALSAVWLDPLGLSEGVYARDCPVTAADVRDMVDAMNSAGMKTIVITYAEYQGSFFYPSKLGFYDRDIGRISKGEFFPFDLIGTMVDQASRNGQKVMVGLGRGGDTHLMGDIGKPGWEERRRYAVELGTRVANEIWARYGGKPSFYGWYLTHESSNLPAAAAYYDPMADMLHGLAPNLPVMIAPTGAPTVNADTIRNSRVDVFAYQDAVGAGYDPQAGYTYDPEVRMAQLESTFSRYREIHDEAGKHLWADLEVWEMDGSQGYSGAYPATFSRVRRQIEIEAKYVDVISAYEYAGFLESPASKSKLRDRRAVTLYRDYNAYRQARQR